MGLWVEMMMQKVVASYASVSGIVITFHLPPVFVLNRDFIAKFEEIVSTSDLIFVAALKRWRLARGGFLLSVAALILRSLLASCHFFCHRDWGYC
jgi:hypothetical protein